MERACEDEVREFDQAAQGIGPTPSGFRESSRSKVSGSRGGRRFLRRWLVDAVAGLKRAVTAGSRV
jgi:hypothetical protein